MSLGSRYTVTVVTPVHFEPLLFDEAPFLSGERKTEMEKCRETGRGREAVRERERQRDSRREGKRDGGREVERQGERERQRDREADRQGEGE